MRSPLHKLFLLGGTLALWALAMLASAAVCAQSAAAPATQDNPAELSAKIELLNQSLQRTQVELAQSRSEIQQLRETLQEMLKRMEGAAPGNVGAGASVAAPDANAPRTTPQESQRAQISQDDWDILNARVEEQRQTKVESASKYRLKLSGLALFNVFSTYGQVDNLDLPSIAVPRFAGYSNGGTGASVRQSIIGVTGIGPVLFSAYTSADLQVGFYGGLPSGYLASSSGIANVRIARVRFDWKNRSAIGG